VLGPPLLLLVGLSTGEAGAHHSLPQRKQVVAGSVRPWGDLVGVLAPEARRETAVDLDFHLLQRVGESNGRVSRENLDPSRLHERKLLPEAST